MLINYEVQRSSKSLKIKWKLSFSENHFKQRYERTEGLWKFSIQEFFVFITIKLNLTLEIAI